MGKAMLDKLYSEVAERIRLARKSQGLSLKELADQAGITSSYLGQVERGERKPSLRTVVLLARALRVPAGQLIEGSPPHMSETVVRWEKRIHALLEGASEEARSLAFDTLRFVFQRLRRNNCDA
jgi:transcriptional regulator with XRE-family HTH domain